MTPGRRYGYQRGRGLSSRGGRVDRGQPSGIILDVQDVTKGNSGARAALRDLVVLAAVVRERLARLGQGRGLGASRERARALIMTGNVLVGGRPETKPGTLVDPAAEIALRTADHPYVSRGALKLLKGLDHFAIDPQGAVALDIGASTGGFSDVLLRRGASRIYAIDVGYGQLAWSIR